jgi:hypothetical protein
MLMNRIIGETKAGLFLTGESKHNQVIIRSLLALPGSEAQLTGVLGSYIRAVAHE